MALFGKNKEKKEKKKKEKRTIERFSSLEVNGEQVRILDVQIVKDDNGDPIVKLIAEDAVEQLHFSEVDMVMKTNKNRIEMKCSFREAFPVKKYKVYVFDLLDIHTYFI